MRRKLRFKVQVISEPLPSSSSPTAEAATLGSQLQGQGIPVQPSAVGPAPGLAPGLHSQGTLAQPSAPGPAPGLGPGPAPSSPLGSHASSDVTVSTEAESDASAHQKHSRQLALGGHWSRRRSRGRLEALGAVTPEVQTSGCT